MPETKKGLFLDLSDTFPGNTEKGTDLFQRHGLLVIQPKV